MSGQFQEKRNEMENLQQRLVNAGLGTAEDLEGLAEARERRQLSLNRDETPNTEYFERTGGEWKEIIRQKLKSQWSTRAASQEQDRRPRTPKEGLGRPQS